MGAGGVSALPAARKCTADDYLRSPGTGVQSRAMQELASAGSNPRFLLKALGEAGGELRNAFWGLSPRDLLRPAAPPDDRWTLLGIAAHLRDTEAGIIRQLEAILSRRDGAMPTVDMDDIPLIESYAEDDAGELLEEFAYYRRTTTYALWDLSGRDWERCGVHPYRGRVSILEIARETYQHDLEHLWQERRMTAAFPQARADGRKRR